MSRCESYMRHRRAYAGLPREATGLNEPRSDSDPRSRSAEMSASTRRHRRLAKACLV
jgi:hypothetical protein